MAEPRLPPLKGLGVLLGGDDPRLVAALTAALVSIGWAAVAHGSGGASALGIPVARVVVTEATRARSSATAWPATSLDVRTIVVGPRSAVRALLTAVARGAVAVIDSEQPFLDLIAQLDAALRGAGPTDRSTLLEPMRDRTRRAAALARLTPREEFVLAQLVEGRTATEIAALSHVSLATVRTQIHGILVKLDVSSQLAAVAHAHRYADTGPVRDAVRQIHQF